MVARAVLAGGAMNLFSKPRRFGGLRGFAVFFLAGTLCLAPRPAGGSDPAPVATGRDDPARSEPVLVTIVVDQLAAWIADERWPLLPPDGGFARLLREGTWVRQLRYAHAGTDTAAGHAALYTGATPRVSGIFGNEWIDEKGESVSMLRDAESRILTREGLEPQTGPGLAALRVETLADRLKAEKPRARAVSFSLKDRGAAFGAGRRPDATLWWDRSRGTFVTATAFTSARPTLLPDVSGHPLAGASAPWDLLDADFVKHHAATPDAQPGEGDFAGMGVTFPHPPPSDPASAFRALPRGDEVLLELALGAIDHHLASPDAKQALLVAISLSANDYVGHVFGPDSWEAWDELRRLDAALGRFFAALDRRLGPGGWAAMLSADHGVATLPEATRAPEVVRECSAPAAADAPRRSCAPGGRIRGEDIAAKLRAAAREALGTGSWVLGFADPYVFYSKEAETLPAAQRAALDRAVVGALTGLPEVERAVPVGDLPRECAPQSEESILNLICEAYPPGSPGDVYVVCRDGVFVDPELVPGRGTSHGSPHLYDRTVPLVVRAPGRVLAGRRIADPMSFRAFTRTAATLLGIAPPEAARTGVDLTQLHAPEPTAAAR